ncbi:Structural maintenance of chromosomes protein 3, partial [Nowakowskiella sp. JEL0078]
MIFALEREIKVLNQQFELLVVEKQGLDEEKKEMVSKKAKLDVEILELEEKDVLDSDKKKLWTEELKEIDEQIRIKESDWEEIVPVFNTLSAEERVLKTRLMEAEQEQAHLFAKQGRMSSFRTIGERDRFLNSEINDLTASIEGENQVLLDVRREVQENNDEILNLQREENTAKQSLETLKENTRDLEKRVDLLGRERSQIDEQK